MAHARTNAPCKHVVALMIQNVMKMEYERKEKQWRQEQEKGVRRRKKASGGGKKAEGGRKAPERGIRRSDGESERQGSDVCRAAGGAEGAPVSRDRAQGGGNRHAGVSGRLGRSARLHRSQPVGFAQRVLDGQHYAYGKGLAFAHDREMFDERDIPLIDLVLLLAEQRVRQNVPAFALKGSLLDQAMRVLLGHEAELKRDKEDPVRVPVRTGKSRPPCRWKRDGGAKLRVKTPDVTLGLSGAYEFLPTGVVCAYGADFRRVEALFAPPRRSARTACPLRKSRLRPSVRRSSRPPARR